MRVLVTWGSKLGGTEGIGKIVADQLKVQGLHVIAEPVTDVRTLEGVDAVIVGGALYANRWHAGARRFVRRHTAALRKVPVWFFSSGPLDDSADRKPLPPPTQVAVLAERVGAKGHITFGGRLPAEAKGFPASAMAKTHAGDWRNPDRIRAWARTLATELPSARPGGAIDHPAHALPVQLAVGALGWALGTALTRGVHAFGTPTAATVIHAVAAPAIFGGLGWAYFRTRGAREPLATALTWAVLGLALDVGLALGAGVPLGILATALPLALAFLATWAAGGVASTLPWPKPPPPNTLIPHPP